VLDEANKVPRKHFDVNAPRMYVAVLQDGGSSIKTLSDMHYRMSAAQARAAILNLTQGLALLHEHRLLHGDVHSHNAVIDDNGHARWIDFSDMQYLPDQDDTIQFQRDVDKLRRVIGDIYNMVSDYDPTLDKMYSNISKGAAPLTAIDMLRDVTRYLGQTVATPKKSKSKSPASDGIRKRLF
jgi:RIO-like serine/threonine protein kinase